MPSNWREMGITITDPLIGAKPYDTELWLSLIYLAMSRNNLELICALIAARQFGQQIQPSPKFGYKLLKPLYYAEHFDPIYKRNQAELVSMLRELANDFPPGGMNNECTMQRLL